MIAILLTLVASYAAAPTDLTVEAPPYDGGLSLVLSWDVSEVGSDVAGFAVLRSRFADHDFEVVTDTLTAEVDTFADQVTTNPSTDPPQSTYHYRVVSLPVGHLPFEAAAKDETPKFTQAAQLLQQLDATPAVAGHTRRTWINTSIGHLHLMALILGIGGLMLFYTWWARQGREIFIRRIPGIDAIEEGIGRATEMGRPVLYVPGIDELQDIQTIASMLILGQVSKTVAEYQADIIVSCCIPMVREVADEVVRAGFFQSGHPDAYNPADVRFISSEQFAFTAGTNGIIHREKPATNLYLGRFFAESLILAETGFVNKSIQIAGTAEATQLPFFVAACDYTLIGEELFAVSAYLSRDPRLISSLKASDYIKVYVVIWLIVGTLLASFGFDFVTEFFSIGEG